jgi:hypothetical protein
MAKLTERRLSRRTCKAATCAMTSPFGVDEANDFIFGELQNALRRQLFDNLGTVPAAVPLAALPPSPLLKPGADAAQLFGLSSTSGLSKADLLNLLKLKAPRSAAPPPASSGEARDRGRSRFALSNPPC